MSLQKSHYKSALAIPAKFTAILLKLRLLLANSPRHIVFEINRLRLPASELTSVAIDESLTTGTITFKRYPAAVVKASRQIQNLLFTADTGGTAGNSITVRYVNDGTAGSETVGVASSAITVHIESGVSTATQVKAAVDASVAAAALVDVSILSGGGAVAQVTQSVVNLSGGLAAASLETYDKADIRLIKRLRTKKYLIVIKDTANPA